MKFLNRSYQLKIITAYACLLLAVLTCFSCSNKKDRSWGSYKADAASTSYSAHDQINLENVQQLQVAWTFYPNDASEGSRFNGSQCNPIIVDGIMYTASARHRIYAIDAKTGQQKWAFDPFDGGPGGGAFRGVTYWEDEQGQHQRVLFTGGDVLFAVDAHTGKIIPEFGDSGRVSMNVGMRDDPKSIFVRPTSPGIIYKDLVIIGNEVSELYGGAPGYVRAYNVITGKLTWTFHTIPLPGEVGYETWPKDAWKYAGGANCWGGMSVDEKRGMVFLSTGSPAYDFYGADREGKNLFGNSVVALDAATGKHIWHFQTVHHDLWDYDLPAPPNLITVTQDGKKIDAVAQTSKVGFLYVFNRETGEPLWPIEERPVPVSDVPGEKSYPTQPFPTKPKAYARQLLTENDLSDFSPAARDSLVQLFRRSRYDGLFTPPSLKGSINFPGTIGGSEWGGAAVDPNTGVIYLKSNESPEMDLLVKIDNSKIDDAAAEQVNGREVYMTYCASCHKADLTGIEPQFPSLVGLKKRLSEELALQRVREGAGKMPPFKQILNGKEKAVIDFLFDKKRDRSVPNDENLKEIQRNRTSNMQLKADSATRKDPSVMYLNTQAYYPLRDLEGRPSIKPPYGTLNAIDLNSGEFLWTVPAGNLADLQQKGAPPTGTTGSPGPIVTGGGLVILGGGRDKQLQAYDKKTGKLVWAFTLPAYSSSSPSSYTVDGKQYIAVSVGGNKEHPAGMIIAFALPN
jgi:quinoprotein glucose dehydrogenase